MGPPPSTWPGEFPSLLRTCRSPTSTDPSRDGRSKVASVAICESGTLVGLLPVERLFAEAGTRRGAGDVMDPILRSRAPVSTRRWRRGKRSSVASPWARGGVAVCGTRGRVRAEFGRERRAGVLRAGDRVHGGCGWDANRDFGDSWTFRRRPDPARGSTRAPYRSPWWARVYLLRSYRSRCGCGACRTSRSRFLSRCSRRVRPPRSWPFLPWVLSRIGKDPAFGSGPLGTVIQDLLSILVYLLTAMVVVRSWV